MLCDLFDRFVDCELLYDYMLCAPGCLDWSLTRYAWLFYVPLCYVCYLCYGPEGNMVWAGRQYVLDRKVVAWKGVYVVGILGVSH